MLTRRFIVVFVFISSIGALCADPLDQWRFSATGISNFTGLAYGNDVFVATAKTGPDSGWLGYSRDGAHWETAQCGGGDCGAQVLYHVLFADGRFVAIGASGLSYRSTDGMAWRAYDVPPSGGTLKDVCFGDGKFVVVGEGDSCPCGLAWGTPDGAAWTALESNDLPSLSGVAYGNGRFVAVGSSEYGLGPTAANVFTATNPLVPWTRRTLSITNEFLSIAFGHDRFVAVGSEYHSGEASIAWSETGDIWVGSDAITTNPLTHVTFAAGTFLAMDNSGQVLGSTDGVIWQLHSLGSGPAQTAPLYANGSFWLATEDAILQSAALSSVVLSVGTQVELTVFGLEGHNVRIESSPDLSPDSWTEVGNLTLYSSPTIWRGDRAAYGQAAFYRSVLVE